MSKDADLFGEDDIILLESLIRSPAFAALKRVVGRYRNQCQAVLNTATDLHILYQSQGRIIGSNVIEDLPELLVKRRQSRLDEEAQKAKLKKQGARPKPHLP